MSELCLAESMMSIVNDENKLFESMLHVQFRKAQVLREKEGDENAIDAEVKDAPAETGTAVATTGNNSTSVVDNKAKEGFVKKAVEIITTLVEKIKAALKTFFQKIKRIVLTDNAVIKKFEEALSNNDNLKGFPGIPNFTEIPNPDLDIDDFIDIAVGNPSNIDINSLENSINEIKRAKEELDKKAFTIENQNPWNKDGSANYDFDSAFVSYKYNIEAENKTFDRICRIYDLFPKKLMEIVNGFINKKEKDKYNLTKDQYKVYYKSVTESYSAFIGSYKKWFKALRRVIIDCGSYAVKKANNPQENISDSFLFAVDFENECYLSEQFANI